MRVLITGISGFVGTSVAEHLTQNTDHEFFGSDLYKPTEGFTNVKYVYGDLRQRSHVDALIGFVKPDVVIHFAAQARVEPSLVDPVGTYRSNVDATINIMEACLKHQVGRLVYASSETIYGEADRYPEKEHYHFRPDNAYAASKAACDILVSNCHGLKSVVVRSAMGYGPRSPPNQVVTKFMLKAIDGKGLLFPDGPVRHPTRDMNYIGNFVEGIRLILQHPDVTGIFNIGSGEEIDMLSLAEKIISIVGNGQIVYDHNFKYRPGEEGKRTWLDITKAKITFGYNPEIHLNEGLERTYNWLIKSGRKLYKW